jgi:hypothetical protein
MEVWVLEVKESEGTNWVPWMAYIARKAWMLKSRLKGNNCLLTDKETRIVRYNLTKKKESNVNSTNQG